MTKLLNNQIVWFVICFVCFISTVSAWVYRDPDEDASLAQLVESRGFALQEHNVTTQDGYILTVHRVVSQNVLSFENSNRKLVTRKPVIIGHCIYCSSDMFFVNSPFLDSNSSKCGDNFGFCLAKQGKYDVWLPNFRGNKYSSKHVNLSSRWQRSYWEFSFQQKAQYDLPAVIELVRNVTQHEKVAYVGYSQGTIMMFALLAEQPKYASIIQPFIAWAPGLFMGDAPTRKMDVLPLRRIGGAFMPFGSRLLQSYCRGGVQARICARTFDWFFGKGVHWNVTRWPVYARSISHGSNWEAVHILQTITARKLMKFDYGSARLNRQHYGQDSPPAYQIENIPACARIILMNGQTDLWMPPVDVSQAYNFLQPKLSSSNVIHYRVPAPVWGHLDFVFGQDAGRFVYDKTVEFLDQFTQ